MTEEYLFISDCHLDAGRPDITAAVTQFIEQRAPGASRLYILGDLFEVWLGDDDPAVAQQPVIASLKHLARDTEIYFLAGNRDFLLADEFALQTGLILLDESELLRLGEQRVMLLHGDTLCTDDHDYQAFRNMVRSSRWQTEFLARPLAERQRIADQLRSDSVDAMAEKAHEIMDVNQQAVQECFRGNEVDTIIHGHTHRPAVHRYSPGLTRYVLGDWNPGPSFLSWKQAAGFELVDSRV